MHNALTLFHQNIASARDLSSIHELLTKQVAVPTTFDDLLRSQLVYAVSAFDKLMHDLIRIGMVEIFSGRRIGTAKFYSEPISMQSHIEIVKATVPTSAFYFEQALVRKFKTASFQDPVKVADGLSYIWNEPQKWQKIGAVLAMTDEAAKRQLKLIVDRRNVIVHEADIDPTTAMKYTITVAESGAAVEFLRKCGEAIFGHVS